MIYDRQVPFMKPSYLIYRGGSTSETPHGTMGGLTSADNKRGNMTRIFRLICVSIYGSAVGKWTLF